MATTLFSDLRKVLKQPSLIGAYFSSLREKAKADKLLSENKDDYAKIVEQGYNDMAADYGKWTLNHERPDRGKYTQLIIDQLVEGSELLELGCGPGDPTTKALSQHLKVTANDISKSCLELAAKNAPSATLIESDMTSLEFTENSFDAVVAFYSFHHVPRDRYQTLLNDIAKWLRPGGKFVAAMYPYDIENLVTTTGWHGANMYWSSYGEEKTLELIGNAGLKVLDTSKESAIENGKETTFLWVVAERPATNINK
ncbi:MAG: class I SAM-dependent methyltransferase, partial [Gammaproteobacteria bacterium]|nr:class I SAM-dependent methyltransferase [Gammaproteobacteria bacterium]